MQICVRATALRAWIGASRIAASLLRRPGFTRADTGVCVKICWIAPACRPA